MSHRSASAGCAAKFGADRLAEVLALLPATGPGQADPRLLVGYDQFDDAAVYQLQADLCLIQTADFFTPMVDDPYTFGQIAAANALSDIYAMGGQPLLALNICCFSPDLPAQVYADILRGGLDKAAEAGIAIAGGHTLSDPEIKYGLSVTGLARPEQIWRNCGAVPGDLLILTKPLGTGVLCSAYKADLIELGMLQPALASMAQLNQPAAQALRDYDPHAVTDVTGFGLAGHAWEMAAGSKVRLRINLAACPLLPQVVPLLRDTCLPGGAFSNQRRYAPFCQLEATVPPALRWLPFDPQTSGGLLVAVAEAQAPPLLQALYQRGVSQARVIGSVEAAGTAGAAPLCFYWQD
ncbi:MAG: selenide, water dikinase SelD [Oscillospiraceae bacterium]|nr:selenide, water dikinase SelD [Oscillospiraceae bacterium]MDD4367639.1 selenide, water dikinase SelD [Oscillospiraceae bacterium]